MGKVIDLEEERQKAKARAKEYPPLHVSERQGRNQDNSQLGKRAGWGVAHDGRGCNQVHVGLWEGENRQRGRTKGRLTDGK